MLTDQTTSESRQLTTPTGLRQPVGRFLIGFRWRRQNGQCRATMAASYRRRFDYRVPESFRCECDKTKGLGACHRGGAGRWAGHYAHSTGLHGEKRCSLSDISSSSCSIATANCTKDPDDRPHPIHIRARDDHNVPRFQQSIRLAQRRKKNAPR